MNERPDDSRRIAPDQSAPVYLVLERNALIAEDIAGSLRAAGPCAIIRVASTGEIAERLSADTRIEAAFLELNYAQVVETGLADTLMRSGTQIILTAGEDDQDRVHSVGWNMLLRPFTDEMIRHAIRPRQITGE